MDMAVQYQNPRKPPEHPVWTRVSYQSILDGWIAGEVVEELKNRLMELGERFTLIKSGSCVRGLAICKNGTDGSDVDVTIVVPDSVYSDDMSTRDVLGSYESRRQGRGIKKRDADNTLNSIRSEKGREIERNKKSGKIDPFPYSMAKIRGPILTESEFLRLMEDSEAGIGTGRLVEVPIAGTRYNVSPETFLSAYVPVNCEVVYDGIGLAKKLKEKMSQIADREEMKLVVVDGTVRKAKRLAQNGYGAPKINGKEFVPQSPMTEMKYLPFASTQQIYELPQGPSFPASPASHQFHA